MNFKTVKAQNGYMVQSNDRFNDRLYVSRGFGGTLKNTVIILYTLNSLETARRAFDRAALSVLEDQHRKRT